MPTAAAKLVALDLSMEVPLAEGLAVVGRAPECDIRIDSKRISRTHCVLAWIGGRLHVRDLGSTNGIRHQGQRVDSACVSAGGEFLIADLAFRVVAGESLRGGAITDSLIERLDVPVMLDKLEAKPPTDSATYGLA